MCKVPVCIIYTSPKPIFAEFALMDTVHFLISRWEKFLVRGTSFCEVWHCRRTMLTLTVIHPSIQTKGANLILPEMNSVRNKLTRSNSCATKCDQRSSNSIHQNHTSRISISEKTTIIKNILKEIKQEKPLGKCPLFKMALTFK